MLPAMMNTMPGIILYRVNLKVIWFKMIPVVKAKAIPHKNPAQVLLGLN